MFELPAASENLAFVSRTSTPHPRPLSPKRGEGSGNLMGPLLPQASPLKPHPSSLLPVCSVVALGARVIALEKIVGMPTGLELVTATTSHTLRLLLGHAYTLNLIAHGLIPKPSFSQQCCFAELRLD